MLTRIPFSPVLCFQRPIRRSSTAASGIRCSTLGWVRLSSWSFSPSAPKRLTSIRMCLVFLDGLFGLPERQLQRPRQTHQSGGECRQRPGSPLRRFLRTEQHLKTAIGFHFWSSEDQYFALCIIFHHRVRLRSDTLLQTQILVQFPSEQTCIQRE